MKAPLSHLLYESFPNSEQVREEYMADYVQASPKKELLGIVMQDK